MTPDKAIEAVAAIVDLLNDGQMPRGADTAKLIAALPTLRRLAEERREAVESLRSIGLVLSPSGCRNLDEMLRDMGYACDTARAFLRRVEEGGTNA